MTELIVLLVSVFTNAVLLALLFLAYKSATHDRQMFNALNENLRVMLNESRAAWDRERQKLLDRIQSTDTEDYALRRNIALSEEAALGESEEEEKETEGWREAAGRSAVFAKVADLIEIDPGGPDEPDSFWIPTGIDKGYSISQADFFRQIGYAPQ